MPDYMCIFEQCGKQLSLQAASKWVAAMPERDRRQVLRDYPDIAASWDDKYGDRDANKRYRRRRQCLLAKRLTILDHTFESCKQFDRNDFTEGKR